MTAPVATNSDSSTIRMIHEPTPMRADVVVSIDVASLLPVHFIRESSLGFGNFERNRLTSSAAIVDARALENKLNLSRSAEAGRCGAATAPCGITSFNRRELS